MHRPDLEYVGFWPRAWAIFLDAILQCIVTYPILIGIYGWEYLDFETTGFLAGPTALLVSWIFPFVVIVAFWFKLQATPGKMAIAASIVDAKTGKNARLRQYTVRYLAYFLSLLPLGLGFFWAAFDKNRQGWHDKFAGTVVIRPRHRGLQTVKFPDA